MVFSAVAVSGDHFMWCMIHRMTGNQFWKNLKSEKMTWRKYIFQIRQPNHLMISDVHRDWRHTYLFKGISLICLKTILSICQTLWVYALQLFVSNPILNRILLQRNSLMSKFQTLFKVNERIHVDEQFVRSFSWFYCSFPERLNYWNCDYFCFKWFQPVTFTCNLNTHPPILPIY